MCFVQKMPMRVRLAELPRCSWTDQSLELGDAGTRLARTTQGPNMGWKHESSCVCTYKREYEYCTVQYKLGSHELSRVEVNVQMEVNVPYSVPCLALVEVRGNGSLRRRGCFWGCELPSLWDSLRRSHPVRWERKKDWRWLMSEG